MPAGGGVARATSARASTRRSTSLWLRLSDCAPGSTSGPAVPGRLSVSRPAAGAAAAISTATSPAAWLGHPMGATSSSTSAGGSPGPPAAAAAKVAVPGAKNPRSGGLEALGGPVSFSFGAEPGRPRPARWAATLAQLRTLQGEYEAWRPDARGPGRFEDRRVASMAFVAVDLDSLDVDLPRGSDGTKRHGARPVQRGGCRWTVKFCGG